MYFYKKSECKMYWIIYAFMQFSWNTQNINQDLDEEREE